MSLFRTGETGMLLSKQRAQTGESLWGLHSKAVHETARDPEHYLRSKAASKDSIFIYTSRSFTH